MDDIPNSPPTLKAFSLLETIASMDHAPTLAELTESANLPKPTLHRWLAMLEGAELVQRLPDGRRYELAARARSLAFAILSNTPGSNFPPSNSGASRSRPRQVLQPYNS